MKNKRKISLNPRGTMLIPVLIIMLMVSAMAISIIGRTKQGAVLTTNTKQGYLAYEASDQATENLLNQLKSFDDKDKQIPENSTATAVCGGNIICYKNSSSRMDNLADGRISEIFRVEDKEMNQGQTMQRSINASVSERVENKIGSFSVNQTGANRCDFKVTWSSPSNASEIDGLELRRSTSPSLKSTLSENPYGWTKVNSSPISLGTSEYLIKNGDPNLGNQYGATYYFSMKAKNKNPLSLDSLFLYDSSSSTNAPLSAKAVMESSKDCSGTNVLDGLSCTAASVKGARPKSEDRSYNCCNGTECLETIAPEWMPDNDRKCALQVCNPGGGDSDEVGLGSSGNASTGYCGTREMCKPGFECPAAKCDSNGKNCVYEGDNIYKIKGFCTSPPGASSQSTFFGNTNWVLSGFADTHESPDLQKEEYRCAQHSCPGGITNNKCDSVAGGTVQASLSSCTLQKCGPYKASVNCQINCNPGFYLAESKGPLNGGENVTVNYNAGCCYQSAPPTPSCQSRGYDCGGTPSWSPVCGGGSWVQGSCYNMAPCPVINCGQCNCSGSCTQTCNGPVDTRVPNPVYSCSASYTFPCQTGTDIKGKAIMGICLGSYSWTQCTPC